jgi:hypothetical protein
MNEISFIHKKVYFIKIHQKRRKASQLHSLAQEMDLYNLYNIKS